MLRISRYNHFQPWTDGNYIAYNARSGAVALMTADNYELYHRLLRKLNSDMEPAFDPKEKELLQQLQYGQFVYESDREEFETIRFHHNYARYDRSSLGLTIAPTMACNMACPYCYEENKKGRMSSTVIESIITYIEKKAKGIDRLDVAWYGGEPLLAMDIIDDLTSSFLDLAEENKFEYHASMISNGYLLTKENVDRLREMKVESVQVTLDGPARLHDLKRPLKNGRGSFDTIIGNLSYASTKIGVGIRVNVDKTFDESVIMELLKVLIDTDLQKRVGVYFGQLEASTSACLNIAENCYDAADFSQVEIDYYRLLLENGFRIDKLPTPSATFCMAQTLNSHLIDPEGEIYRCFNYVGDSTKSMGNIRNEIDHEHPNFANLFKFDPFHDKMCGTCELLPVCLGGCPARRADRSLAPEQLCDTWKHNLHPMLEIIARSRQQQAAATAGKE